MIEHQDVSEKELQDEAVLRMGILGLPDKMIDAYKQGQVYVTEPVFNLVSGYSITDYVCEPCDPSRKTIADVISFVQSELHAGTVFYVMKDYLSVGEIFTMLSVFPYPSDWQYERDQLAALATASDSRGIAIAATWSFPQRTTFIKDGFAEVGMVGLDMSRGFPVRVG